MKVLYLECEMGAAGDMLSAALFELLDEESRHKYLAEINAAGIDGVNVSADRVQKCGITGTHMSVLIDGFEEGHGHDHVHEHEDHDHVHEHDHMHEHEDHDHMHEHDDHDHVHEHDHMHEHEDHDHVHEHGDHDHEHVLEHDHSGHGHDHGHEHGHHHASLADVHGMIERSDFSPEVKKKACGVYDLIAAAESAAHGRDVNEIHFHEVGMKDAVIDVLGCCRLVEMIGADRIVVSPVCVGFGEVRCAHGIIPVPAPATIHILRGVPIYSGNIRGEMCTPTGAALLKSIADEFGNMPDMNVQAVGYGMGMKDFEKTNCVRAFLGDTCETESEASDVVRGGVVELSVNLDDMTGETVGYCAELLRSAGALEVYSVPVYMKKNRPGIMLTVLCRTEDEDKMSALIFKHTTTWGIRRRDVERHCMSREIVQVETKYGPVRVKVGRGFGVTKTKPEYEDMAQIASRENISISEISAMVSRLTEDLINEKDN